MRFRPANIRAINRRNSRLDRDLRCLPRRRKKKQKKAVDRSFHISTLSKGRSTQMLAKHISCQELNCIIRVILNIREAQLSDRLADMPCKSCGSTNQREFTGEIGIHFPGLQNLDKPVVWVFPEIVVCLDCGTAEFVVPKVELRQLAKGDAAAAG
jgi:hypothetical protein